MAPSPAPSPACALPSGEHAAVKWPGRGAPLARARRAAPPAWPFSPRIDEAAALRSGEHLRHGGGGTDPDPAEGGGGGRPSSETAALRNCASTISAAASLARQSSAELTKLEPDLDVAAGTTSPASSSSSSAAGGDGVSSRRQARWEVSNAKTWLSAAMANEGTCADGLVEAGAAAASSPAGKEVTAGVATAKQYTSNALALVNGIPL
ncbi:pectinesterase 3-like [Miscanthus floridulus]|uniref:pectinesterase 3-like n=1 Tax=Miscanthus floridulus TaxID=154761 RepID=UPI0034583528